MEVTELTWADQMFERGLEQGRQQGLHVGREAVLRVLTRQFGALPPAISEHLARVNDPQRLQVLLDAAFAAGSLEEFARGLE